MNAIVTAFAEQGLVLGAILLLAIYLQAKIHKESAALRKDMSDIRDDLRKDISGARDDLRKDVGKLGERLARIEGPLPLGAPYDSVAEPPSDEESETE